MDGLVTLVPPAGDEELGTGLAGDEAGGVAVPPHREGSSRVTAITQLGPVLLCVWWESKHAVANSLLQQSDSHSHGLLTIHRSYIVSKERETTRKTHCRSNLFGD